MMIVLRLYLLITLFSVSGKIYGQYSGLQPYRRAKGVSYNFLAGKTLDIHPFFPKTKTAFIYKGEIFSFTDGNETWQQYYNYPETGITLNITNFGNPEVLGSSIAAIPHLRFHKRGKRSGLAFKVGGGLAYFSDPFDAIKNPDNLVIGSILTAAIDADLSFIYMLSPKWEVSLSASFSHYSNGHYSVPNIGANVAGVGIGIRYYDVPRSDSITTLEYEEPEKKIFFGGNIALGIHEIEGTVFPYDGPRYPVYEGNLYMDWRSSYKHKWQFGFNYAYYTAFYDQIVSQELFKENLRAKSAKWIVYGGHEYLFGHMGIFLNVGVNLSYPVKNKWIELGHGSDSFLHRTLSNNIGINFYFKSLSKSIAENPYIGVGIKAIGGKADYLQFRTGIAF